MQTYIFRRPTFGGRFLCPAVSVLRPAVCGRLLRPVVCGRQNFPRAALRAYFSPTLYRPRWRPILLRAGFVRFSLVQPCAAAHGGGILRRLLCGRQSFSAPCPCRAAEFLLIIAHRRQKGKAIWRQNLFRPKTPPSAHKTHSLFSQKGRAFCTECTGVKNIFDPPCPSAAGGAGVSAFSRLRPASSPFAAGRGLLPLPRCKTRLFLHIVPMQGIKLPSTGQTIGEDPNGCAAELHMMI